MVLQQIDNEMREYFGQPPNDNEWLAGWYNSIGLRLACQKTFDEIIAGFDDDLKNGFQTVQIGPPLPCPWAEDLGYIAMWLDERFNANSWAQVGR